jgi:hypothetical protein
LEPADSASASAGVSDIRAIIRDMAMAAAGLALPCTSHLLVHQFMAVATMVTDPADQGIAQVAIIMVIIILLSTITTTIFIGPIIIVLEIIIGPAL